MATDLLHWSWNAATGSPLHVFALVVAVAILARCVWSRAWVYVAGWMIYMVFVGLTTNRIAARAADNPYASRRLPHVNYLAARALPVNRRLTESDLQEPDDLPLGYFWRLPPRATLVGRYLAAAVERRSQIDVDAVRGTPVLQAGGWMVPIVPAELESTLNAGATIRLCTDTNECVPGQILVEAVVCARPGGPCYAALAPLDATRREALDKARTPLLAFKTIVPVTLP